MSSNFNLLLQEDEKKQWRDQSLGEEENEPLIFLCSRIISPSFSRRRWLSCYVQCILLDCDEILFAFHL